MDAALALLARYELPLYGALVAVAAASLAVFWASQRQLSRTPFGLEKYALRRRQNLAAAGVFLALLGSLAVFGLNRYGVLAAPPEPAGTPAPAATALPTPTAIVKSGPLTVDSSGCRSEGVMLTQPASGETISGAYEMRGTASIPNFAFYKIEMSGAATSGAWVTLAVGNVPQIDAPLGTFDPAPYQPGTYALRLVVTDNVGQAAPPCVIVIALAGGAATPAP